MSVIAFECALFNLIRTINLTLFTLVTSGAANLCMHCIALKGGNPIKRIRNILRDRVSLASIIYIIWSRCIFVVLPLSQNIFNQGIFEKEGFFMAIMFDKIPLLLLFG
jgi:hypothetical protein